MANNYKKNHPMYLIAIFVYALCLAPNIVFAQTNLIVHYSDSNSCEKNEGLLLTDCDDPTFPVKHSVEARTTVPVFKTNGSGSIIIVSATLLSQNGTVIVCTLPSLLHASPEARIVIYTHPSMKICSGMLLEPK